MQQRTTGRNRTWVAAIRTEMLCALTGDPTKDPGSEPDIRILEQSRYQGDWGLTRPHSEV